jgi:REP element-mobilizing transposase RayT
MARPLRLEFPGAIYHVTSRGDRQEAIYEGDADRQQWLEILSKICERYNWRVHAYCLMDNHYHILLETADGNLSKGMRQLNGVYTQYFNRQHNRMGHVFQGRYKAILVEKDSYLLELSRYVVLNPIRAGMIKNIDEWHWSSYLITIGKLQPPDWLEVDWLLSQFGLQRNRARGRYIDFVREGIGLPPVWDNLRHQIYMGSDDFINKHQELISKKQDLDDIPALQKRAMPKPISYYQKKYKNEKQAITQAFLSGGHTLKEIGDYYGKHYTTISRIVKLNE